MKPIWKEIKGAEKLYRNSHHHLSLSRRIICWWVIASFSSVDNRQTSIARHRYLIPIVCRPCSILSRSLDVGIPNNLFLVSSSSFILRKWLTFRSLLTLFSKIGALELPKMSFHNTPKVLLKTFIFEISQHGFIFFRERRCLTTKSKYCTHYCVIQFAFRWNKVKYFLAGAVEKFSIYSQVSFYALFLLMCSCH